MANFKVWVETTRAGNFLVRYRDGSKNPKTGRLNKFTGDHVEKTQTLDMNGKTLSGKWLANALAEKVLEKFYKNELAFVAVDEPLAPLIDKYISECEQNGLQWTTVEQYAGDLRQLNVKYGFIALADLNTEKLKAFKTAAIGVWEASTVRKRMIVLFSFCSWLVENKQIKAWPFAKRMLPTLKERTPKYYALQEWDALDKTLSQMNIQAQLACSLAYYAGLRKVEIVGDGRDRKGILWEDLIWNSDGTVDLMVRKEVVKGEKRARRINLAPEIISLLGSRKTGPIITLTRNQFTYIVLGKARKKSGIKEDLTIHGQRHSFARSYLEDGDMPLSALQQMLGHGDIQTTQIYSAHEKSHLAKGIQTAYQSRLKARTLLHLAGQKDASSLEILEPIGTQENEKSLDSSNVGI